MGILSNIGKAAAKAGRKAKRKDYRKGGLFKKEMI